MSTYPTLSIGSRDTDSNGDVRKLQQALSDAGYRSYLGNAGIDGIYGKNTAKAVAKYQSDNALQVDGIVGKQTLGHLYGTTAAPATNTGVSTATRPTTGTGVSNTIGPTATAPAVPDASRFAYDAAANTGYTQAQAATDQARTDVNALEDPYAVYAQQLRDSYDQYVNREPFSYDVNADALYQQYKDIYTTQGQLAMQDTMGQAAALTGGYGNTYAQNVGQQAYQSYLQQLSAVVPELYQMAYDRYSDEGNAMLNRYSLLSDMASNAYSHYRDQVSDGWQNVNYLQNQADTEYERGYQNWYNSLQLGIDADNTAYARQQDSYDQLERLIAMGYTPTQDDLTATGMKQEEADTIKNYYHPTATTATTQNPTSSNIDNGGLDDSQILAMQRELKITDDGLWGPESQAAALAKWGTTDANKAWRAYQEDKSSLKDSQAAKNFRSNVMDRTTFARHNGKVLLDDGQTYTFTSYSEYIDAVMDRWLGTGRLTEDDVEFLQSYYFQAK